MQKSRKFQTSNVLYISIAHFVHDTYTAFLAPVVPLLKSKFGINNTLVSLLFVV